MTVLEIMTLTGLLVLYISTLILSWRAGHETGYEAGYRAGMDDGYDIGAIAEKALRRVKRLETEKRRGVV